MCIHNICIYKLYILYMYRKLSIHTHSLIKGLTCISLCHKEFSDLPMYHSSLEMPLTYLFQWKQSFSSAKL